VRLKPLRQHSKQLAGDPHSAKRGRDEQVLQFAVAAVPLRQMTGNVGDHPLIEKRYVSGSRRQRMLRMMLAVEIRGHAGIGRACG